MYALNLDNENRILSATLERFAQPEQPRVKDLPSGNITDYLYINKSYVYDPLPVPPEPTPEPTVDEILDALLGVEA